MPELSKLDLGPMFVPSGSLGEMVLRGTLVYLFIFVLFRLLRREAGALSITDLLVVVLIADAAQNAMANEYRSITEGAVLIATIAGWDYFLDWLAFRVPWVERLVTPAPLPLIKDGRIMRKNLRQEMIKEEQLTSNRGSRPSEENVFGRRRSIQRGGEKVEQRRIEQAEGPAGIGTRQSFRAERSLRRLSPASC
jgi:hypothetical protein